MIFPLIGLFTMISLAVFEAVIYTGDDLAGYLNSVFHGITIGLFIAGGCGALLMGEILFMLVTALISLPFVLFTIFRHLRALYVHLSGG